MRMPLLQVLVRCIGFFDLRFPSINDDEAAFRKSVQSQLVVRSAMLFFIHTVFSVGCSIIYVKESGRADNPFQWSLEGPRAHSLFLPVIIGVPSFAVCVVCFFHLYFGCCQSWNWELTSVVVLLGHVITLPFTSSCISTSIWGASSDNVWTEEMKAAQSFMALTLNLAIATICMFLPIRSCILWILPLGAWVSFTTLSFVVGPALPGNEKAIPAVLGVLLCFSYYGACEKERNTRTKWLANSEIHENSVLAEGMQDLAKHFCNVVIKLDSNWRAIDVDSSHEEFFQVEMEGRSLMEVIPTEYDQSRFWTLMNQVNTSRIPGCITVTIDRHSGPLNVTLLVVPIGVKTLKYLVAARSEEEIMPAMAMLRTSSNSHSSVQDLCLMRRPEHQVQFQRPLHSHTSSPLHAGFYHSSVSECSAFSGRPIPIGEFGSTEFDFSFNAFSLSLIHSSAYFDRLFGSFPPGSDCSRFFCSSTNDKFWKLYQESVNNYEDIGNTSANGNPTRITFQGPLVLEHHPVQYHASCMITLSAGDESELHYSDEPDSCVAHAVLTYVKVNFSLARQPQRMERNLSTSSPIPEMSMDDTGQGPSYMARASVLSTVDEYMSDNMRSSKSSVSIGAASLDSLEESSRGDDSEEGTQTPMDDAGEGAALITVEEETPCMVAL